MTHGRAAHTKKEEFSFLAAPLAFPGKSTLKLSLLPAGTER